MLPVKKTLVFDNTGEVFNSPSDDSQAMKAGVECRIEAADEKLPAGGCGLDQLTLHLGPTASTQPLCFNRHRRRQMLRSRAQWWFRQMRRKVEESQTVEPLSTNVKL